MYDYTQDNLSVTNGCYTCMLAQQTCEPCADEQDARRTEMAHQIIENGGDFYYRKVGKAKIAVANSGAVGEKNTMSILSDDPSGHEWVGAQTMRNDGSIRDEFLEPMTLLSDRFFDINVEVPVGSTVCADCHYVCNTAIACPNCELVNY